MIQFKVANAFRTVMALALLMLVTTTSAFAQGRDITPDDWVDRLPIFFIVVVIVLFVDFLFIRVILKDRKENQDRIK